MNNIAIDLFSSHENEAAIQLEQLCPQGDSLKIKFIRKDFLKRSEVYEKSIVLSAKCGNKLIGVAAGAEKEVMLNGKQIKAVYGYDLRVHPDYRKYGTAKKLTQEVLNYFGSSIDCNYAYIAAQNERALGLIKRSFGAQVIIPFVYFVFPVFKKRRCLLNSQFTSIEENHRNYLCCNNKTEFTANMLPEKMLGQVASLNIKNESGCSIWNNEDLISEKIVNLPLELRLIGQIQKFTNHIIRTPRIPQINEVMKSWFIYDLFYNEEQNLYQLLNTINNYALEMKINYLYLFVQKSSSLYYDLKKLNRTKFTLPYYFLARGKAIPAIDDKIYVDVRDL